MRPEVNEQSKKNFLQREIANLLTKIYARAANNESSEICGHLLPVTYLISPFDQA